MVELKVLIGMLKRTRRDSVSQVLVFERAKLDMDP